MQLTRDWFRKQASGYTFGLGLLTFCIFVVLALVKPAQFLSLTNLRSMAFQFPEFALLALAVMITMLTGGIDLSVVSVGLLSAILGCITLQSLVLQASSDVWVLPSVFLCVLIILGTGVICGLANGILVSRVGISPILATLGTMQVFGGLAIVLTGGTTIYGFPDAFVFLGNGALVGLPFPFLLFLLVFGLVALVLNRTSLGMRIVLLGGNPCAARFAGIRSKRVLTQTYMMSGLLASVAGLVMVARTNSANADYGSSYLLLAILIAVLGGVNPAGGFGKVSGVVLAVLSLQFLSSGLNLLRFSSFSKEIVWGGLLLVVMVWYRVARRLAGPSPGAKVDH
jgi:simple sugar transport system permease protein